MKQFKIAHSVFFEKLFTKVGFLRFIAVLFLFFFTYKGYLYQQANPPCCDADYYFRLSNIGVIKNISIFDNPDPIRTYGIQLFYNPLIRIANLISISPQKTIFFTQTILYVLFVSLLSFQLKSFSDRVSKVVFFSLIFNIFLYPFFSLTLTEAFSMSLFLALLLILIKIYKNQKNINSVNFLKLEFTKYSALIYDILLNFLFGLLIGLAIMVRPANIYLILFIIPLILIKKRLILYSLPLVVLGFGLSLYPQVKTNEKYYNSTSFLPVDDIPHNQFNLGIQVIKYATFVSKIQGGKPIYYMNPFYISEKDKNQILEKNEKPSIEIVSIPSRLLLRWYLENPLAGIATIGLHIFNVFDFDYYYPYIYNQKISYRFLLFLYSHTIVFWFIIGVIFLISFLKKEEKPILNSKLFLYIILLFVLIGGAISIHSFSAVDNRFALQSIALMLPLASWSILYFRSTKNLVWFLVYLIIAWKISTFVSQFMIFPT